MFKKKTAKRIFKKLVKNPTIKLLKPKNEVQPNFGNCFVACNFNCFHLIEESMKKTLIS